MFTVHLAVQKTKRILFISALAVRTQFLCYRADRKNIEKDTETIEAELTVIAGKAAMNKAQTFSYVPTTSGVKEIKESNELAYTDRYGDLFAKFIK